MGSMLASRIYREIKDKYEEFDWPMFRLSKLQEQAEDTSVEEQNGQNLYDNKEYYRNHL
jgi:hypothetical protein